LVIDTEYLEEENETQDMLVNFPVEGKEEIKVETVESMHTELKELAQHAEMSPELTPHRVTVTEKPQVHEEVKHVREPEPLNLKPRREPEETKPKMGRLAQSVHMMMAYQGMYQ